MRSLVTLIFIIISLGACRPDSLVNVAISEARENAPEIQRVLDYYKDERAGMAGYMVAAMVGQYAMHGAGTDSVEALYRRLPRNGSWGFDSLELAKGKRFASLPFEREPDLQAASSAYLIANLEDAYSLWRTRKWNAGLSRKEFCELLLPYRIGDEPLTSWREPYRKWLSELEDTLQEVENSVDAARIVSHRIGSTPYNDRLSMPHRSALDLLEAPVGYCREDCDRTLYAMRALGIPAATDMMLVSPDNGASHQWNVVYDNIDRRFRMFDNEKYHPTRDSIHDDRRRKGKVYRRTFALNLDRLKKFKNTGRVPASLLNPHLEDVTAEYFGTNKAEVETRAEGDVYLGLFVGQGFKPVDVASRKGGKSVFTDMEPKVIFFPVTSSETGFTPCGYPFMLAEKGTVHTFKPDEGLFTTVSLTRKYPVRFHLKDRMASVIGIRIQSGPTSHGPWTDLHVMEEAPAHSFFRIPLPAPLKRRYVRLYKPEGNGSNIGELIASVDSLGLERLPLAIVGDKATRNKYREAVDGDILTPMRLLPGEEDFIVRIESNGDVENLFLVPHNDDNFVLPAQTYELFYFDGAGWASLGRKVSTGFSIEFRAPDNAVLLLRNLTKGKEEQVFVYRDGRQLFNIDLGE